MLREYFLVPLISCAMSALLAGGNVHDDNDTKGPVIPATQTGSEPGKHGPVTERGQPPHGSSDAPQIAAEAATTAVAVALIVHFLKNRPPSPESLGNDGPRLAHSLDMSGFTVTGLAKANEPVALDFAISQPGTVEVEILGAKKQKLHATLTNTLNSRGIAKFYLPNTFTEDLRTAVFQVHFVSPAGVDPAPGLRVYGMGVGEKAVGSVAIDQLTFEPATVHPLLKEVAQYGFHAHSAFDGEIAEFVFTTSNNGHILVQKDQEKKLTPVGAGDRDSQTWDANGKAGQHQLQVRAWRGLQNGGDWVVAWSPEIVDVVK